MNTKIGAVGRASIAVTEADLATALVQSERELPTRLCNGASGWAHEARCPRVFHADFAPGELSVGVTVDIQHTAATPMGVVVEAQATLVGKEGKLFVLRSSHETPGARSAEVFIDVPSSPPIAWSKERESGCTRDA